MPQAQCSCLIPFFNEGQRLLHVLEQLTQISKLHSIICVDDGSTDQTADLVRQHFPQVKVVGYSQNLGKSAAVSYGMRAITTSHVLLFDADLRDFSTTQLTTAIKTTLLRPKIEMVVFRQLNDPFLLRLLKFDILVSGERILKTKDLKQILTDHPQHYQLEFSINNYFLKHHKLVFWTPFQSNNYFKLSKWSLLTSLKKILQFQTSLWRAQYFYQLVKFNPVLLRRLEEN